VKPLALAAILITSTAIAGVIVTERAGVHELRRRGGTELLGTFPTHAACVAAVPVPTTSGLQEFTCKAVTHVDVVGTCTDVPPPPPVVDAEGFTDVGSLRGDLCPGSTTRYRLLVTKMVRDDATFPTCWALREVEEFGCSDPPELTLPPPYVPVP
jgi:hypothetical protein